MRARAGRRDTFTTDAMWLLLIALFGLVVPNGIFLHWAAVEFSSVGEVLSNRLAIAFILDAFMALGVLSYLFAVHPLGPVRWPWFILLSLVGGLGFSIPFFIWLNRRQT
ncbi:MAG TPA: hypothetical protein VM599_10115 [Thermoanaerobaculia bacterium]|nr:hypothetical protein [Thermoanaerobaculia bacterium]